MWKFVRYNFHNTIIFTLNIHNLVIQTKEDNLKKMMKEYADLEYDLKTVQNLCKY